MGRPMPSAVSALWGCVANGHQAVHHVSLSPSKIPYGGFSPVRLQAGRRRQPSPSLAGLYAAQASSALAHNSPSGNRRTASASRRTPSKRTGPEALGSAAGCVVPPRQRLLRPHPRFSVLPAAYCPSSAGSLPRRPEPRRSLIWAACLSIRAVSHTPVDRMAVTVVVPSVMPSPLWEGLGVHDIPTWIGPCGGTDEAAEFA